MSTRGPRIRGYRILRKMKRFEYSGGARATSSSPDVQLHLDETLIGCYRNYDGSSAELLVITDRALWVRRDTVWGRTEYQQMKSVSVEGPKHEATSLTIRLRTGGVIHVPVRRGEGRLRDIWTFVRYLTRVIEDIDEEKTAEKGSTRS